MYFEIYAMQYFHIPFPLISVDLSADFSQGPVPHDTVFGITPFQKPMFISTAFEPGFQCFSILQSPEQLLCEHFRNLEVYIIILSLELKEFRCDKLCLYNQQNTNMYYAHIFLSCIFTRCCILKDLDKCSKSVYNL